MKHDFKCATCGRTIEVLIDNAAVVHICPVVQTGDRYRQLKEVKQ